MSRARRWLRSEPSCAPRVGFVGDGRVSSVHFNDSEAATAGNHMVYLRPLVTRKNHEAATVIADLLVFGGRDLERFGAAGVAAFAGEQAHARLVPVARQFGDAFVHLAEDDLIASALLKRASHQSPALARRSSY